MLIIASVPKAPWCKPRGSIWSHLSNCFIFNEIWIEGGVPRANCGRFCSCQNLTLYQLSTSRFFAIGFKGVPRGEPGRAPGPNQIPAPIEKYWFRQLLSDWYWTCCSPLLESCCGLLKSEALTVTFLPTADEVNPSLKRIFFSILRRRFTGSQDREHGPVNWWRKWINLLIGEACNAFGSWNKPIFAWSQDSWSHIMLFRIVSNIKALDPHSTCGAGSLNLLC